MLVSALDHRPSSDRAPSDELPERVANHHANPDARTRFVSQRSLGRLRRGNDRSRAWAHRGGGGARATSYWSGRSLDLSGDRSCGGGGSRGSGYLDEAQDVLSRAERRASELGGPGLEIPHGRILLASGKPAEARAHLERAMRRFEGAGLRLWPWRAGTLAAEAAAQSGDRDTATSLFASCIHDAHMAGALRPREDAQGRAARHALDVPSLPEAPGARPPEPDILGAGERFVTSMC